MQVKGMGAIVTGGASGLGEASARALAAAGAKVTIFDLNEERGEEVAREIGGIFAKVDVSSADDVSAGIAKGREAHGVARVLINCAGIAPPAKTVGRDGPMPLELFTKVININLVGSFNCIRLMAADLVEAEPLNEDGERGVIVNTASVAAFDGQIGQAAYSASKGGIVGMTLPIARDFMNVGIRVCTIAPGLFATPLMNSLPENVQEALAASVPFPKRLGRPSEYADLAMHIVSNEMLNGEVIRLDGAIRMAPR